VSVLHIDSSINGQNSASRVISGKIVEQLKAAAQSEDEVIYRDLAAEPLPHLTLDQFADTSVLDEFLAADTVVIGAPMYNFTLPSQLKAWIDRILVVDKTFRYSEDGPEGLASATRVIIALARGGIYGEGAMPPALEHHLRAVFNFIGIDPEFVVAEGLSISPQHRETSISQALGDTFRLAA
jgi:FMN-dependent NADH-azoreductase